MQSTQKGEEDPVLLNGPGTTQNLTFPALLLSTEGQLDPQ